MIEFEEWVNLNHPNIDDDERYMLEPLRKVFLAGQKSMEAKVKELEAENTRLHSALDKANGMIEKLEKRCEDYDTIDSALTAEENAHLETKAKLASAENEKVFLREALEFLAHNEGVTAVGIYARGKIADLVKQHKENSDENGTDD